MNSNLPILLVEDDKVDQITTKRAFKDAQINNPLAICENGEEALLYLRDHTNLTPCLILLDINMPRMNGIEFLQNTKRDDELKSIPTVVLTTSSDDRDKEATYDLGISGYMLKPVGYEDFVSLLKAVDLYWSLSVMPTD